MTVLFEIVINLFIFYNQSLVQIFFHFFVTRKASVIYQWPGNTHRFSKGPQLKKTYVFLVEGVLSFQMSGYTAL